MAIKSDTIVYDLRQCAFSYPAAPILADLDLRLRGGKFYGLIGPNGSGKTTMINLLCGTHRPSRGTVLLHGRRVDQYPKAELATLLSYVPQSFDLDFDYTAWEVVLMGRHPAIGRFGSPSAYDRRLVDDALAILDISGLKDRYVTRLSGGERQRVLVARALAQNCDVMVLDEATANLDIRHSIDIMQALRHRVTQGRCTVIAAVHDLDLAAAFCDELIVLQGGRLFSSGPVSRLLTPEMLQRVFGVHAQILSSPNQHPPHIQYRYHHG